MVYNVEVKVEAIRHMTVEAATVEEAEEIGLKEAIDLVGGIDGTVLGVWSDPKKFIDEAIEESKSGNLDAALDAVIIALANAQENLGIKQEEDDAE